jgi:O-antigen/teichoic acid export membrane protein
MPSQLAKIVINNSRIKHWTKLLLSFLAGQGSVQVLNLLTGFFLLRWLSVEDFAQLSVVLGFQTTVGLLVDVGFSNSITALVGNQFQDKVLVGKYVRAAQEFRNKLFVVIIPIAGISFCLIANQHNWPFSEQIILFGSIAASLFFQGWVGYYSSSLLMNKKVIDYYKPQIAGSFLRLSVSYLLYLIAALSSLTNAWISTAATAINGFYYRHTATNFLFKQKTHDSHVSKEMLRYISPLIPGVIFVAFQGQISLFLITILGKTSSIAEVAALGRLGQIFALLGAFNGIIIEPYIAQISREILPRRYFQILIVAIFIVMALCTIGFVFPQILLWLLGSKYQNLELEVGWVVAGSSLSYLSSVLWTMHCARKWIYWWTSFVGIISLLLTQLSCLLFIDLSTTLGVTYFSFISVAVNLLIHILNGVFGFKYGAKDSGVSA